MALTAKEKYEGITFTQAMVDQACTRFAKAYKRSRGRKLLLAKAAAQGLKVTDEELQKELK